MSIATEIERLKNSKVAIKTSLINKGVTVSDDAKLDEYPTLIDGIETGGGEIEDYFMDYKDGYKFYSTLIKIPQFDTSAITDMSSMFSGLPYITEVPLFNTSSVTSMGNMFNGCQALISVPQFDTSKVTNMASMFNTCSDLISIPQFNTSSVTSMSSMFYSCSSLIEIPLLDTSSVTSMNKMIRGCSKLTTIPQFDTSKVTNMGEIFYNCYLLVEVPLLDASSVTVINNAFYSARSVTTLGGFKDLGKAYLTTASENYSSYTLTLSPCTNLTHDSLMNVINNLYDIASAGVQPQKLVLGTTLMALLTEDEIAIATNKGWTVS